LRSVNVTTRTPTAAELSQLDILQSQLETAEMAMLDAELAAWQRWQLFTSNGMTTAPFAQWVTQGYPAYIRTRDAYWNADQRYQNYYRQIYGASNTNLVQQSRDITAARSRLGFVPGCVDILEYLLFPLPDLTFLLVSTCARIRRTSQSQLKGHML
jgi:hypothetical protein